MSSNSSVCVGVCALSCFSRARLFEIPWTVNCQVPLSLGLSRQEYWSGLPYPSPEDPPDTLKGLYIIIQIKFTPEK